MLRRSQSSATGSPWYLFLSYIHTPSHSKHPLRRGVHVGFLFKVNRRFFHCYAAAYRREDMCMRQRTLALSVQSITIPSNAYVKIHAHKNKAVITVVIIASLFLIASVIHGFCAFVALSLL
ncbi:predicted protein [Lichtheimia corymbifera JMRC:FSU:9682]|uniref:Transmembrane protein n=1 Tax=Lichtheimia corymbifera JMRC:FSU:9682 TaxID=1263082 RepID=A0A068RSW3_9FUNG|nr:predicted protein [Lichtheimia corymbifera JMRC:FSU:9682]